jgi:hypothetical protein
VDKCRQSGLSPCSCPAPCETMFRSSRLMGHLRRSKFRFRTRSFSSPPPLNANAPPTDISSPERAWAIFIASAPAVGVLLSMLAGSAWLGKTLASQNAQIRELETKLKAQETMTNTKLQAQETMTNTKLQAQEKLSIAEKDALETKLKAQEEINKERLQRRGALGLIFGW